VTKPKVLFVAQNHPAVRPGGAEGYALDLYSAMGAAGEFEPVFLARTGPPISSADSRHATTPFTAVNEDSNQYFLYTDVSNYNWLFGRPPQKTILTRHFRDFLLAHRPDVVHFQHSLFIGYDVLRLTRNTLPDAPILYMLHEYLPICHRDGQLVRIVDNTLCRDASPRRCHECFPEISEQTFFMRRRFIQSHLSLVDLFLAPSEYVRDRYADWGIPKEKIAVEPYACYPVEPVSNGGRPGGARNRFAFFGQFTPYKGADVLLEAMQILGDGFPGHLWIYGANLETQRPEFRERFSSLLEQTGRTVTFAGRYDHADLRSIIEQMDWVVVPSTWWETGPIVVLEAFQYGRPVICSDIGGMSEKVTDGVNGLHFQRSKPTSLADAIRRAATEPGLWDRLRAGIPSVTMIEDRAAALAGIYRELLTRRHARAREDAEAGAASDATAPAPAATPAAVTGGEGR
jgi:glycosyltransferase involved in cell wall biosynthesis